MPAAVTKHVATATFAEIINNNNNMFDRRGNARIITHMGQYNIIMCEKYIQLL